MLSGALLLHTISTVLVDPAGLPNAYCSKRAWIATDGDWYEVVCDLRAP